MNKRQRTKRQLKKMGAESNKEMRLDPRRVVVETHPSPDVRTYHIAIEISQYPIHRFERPLRESSKRYMGEVGEVGSNVLKKVFSIPGIVCITIKPYELHVEKGMAFSWEDIEPKMLRILDSVPTFSPEGTLVQI